MNRFSNIAIVAVMFLGMAAVGNAQAPVNQAYGTYLHQVEVGPGFYVPALLTLNIDGTLTVASGLTFGGYPGATTKVGPVHGIWMGVGVKSIVAKSIFFVYDTDGVLIGYQRNRCSMRFNQQLTKYTGTEYMETTSCDSPFTCPDPLDPGTKWEPLPDMPPGGFSVSGKRVQMLP